MNVKSNENDSGQKYYCGDDGDVKKCGYGFLPGFSALKG